MSKKVVVYVVMLLFCQWVYGQEGNIMTNLKSNLKRADELYEKYAYRQAVDLYEFVLKKSPDNHRIKLKLADCYRKLNDNVNAAKWYKIIVNNDTIVAPIHYLYYAQALNANSQYEEAKHWYGKYQEQIKNDNRVLNRIWGINNLSDFYRDSTLYTIHKLSVNSQASDFSPSFYKDGLVFVSSVGKEIFIRHVYSWDQSALLDVYFSHIQPDGNLSEPQKFNGVNSRYHEGPAIFYDNDQKMIFTRTSVEANGKIKNGQDGIKRVGLFSAEQSKDGKGWTAITPLPFNSDNYSVGHPAITRDGLTLYFISDMPGGYGGMDIYYSKLEGGTWGKPVNLGPQINTEGNEMFPFIYADSILYFSSDGYGGLGGLDVYKADLKGDDALIVTNLGYPINTNADDFAFIQDKSGQAGYFSSNRKGGKGNDDIYRFRLLSLMLDVRITGLPEKQPLKEAQITLTSTRTKLEVHDTVRLGNRVFSVNRGENYILRATKEGYTAKTVIIPTHNYRHGDTLRVKVELEKEKANSTPLVILVHDAETGEPLPQAQVYLLDEVTSEEKMLTTSPKGLFTFNALFTSSYAIIAEKGDKSGILSGVVAQNPAIAGNDTVKVPVHALPKSTEQKQLTKIALEGLVMDAGSRSLLAGANVRLYEMEGQKETIVTQKDGKISLDLNPGNYILKIDKDDYTNKSIVFSTRNLGKTEKPQLNINLNKGKDHSAPLIAYVYDEETHKGVAGAEIYLLNEVTSDERTIQTDEKGYFRFDANFDYSYAIIAEKGDKSNMMTGLTAQHPVSAKNDTIKIPLVGPSSLPVTKEIHPATILSTIEEDKNEAAIAAKVTIRSTVADQTTGLPLQNAVVALFDNATGNEVESRLENNFVYFEAKAGSNYILKSSKSGYRNKIAVVTTKDLAMGDTIPVNVAMEKSGPVSTLVKAQLVDQKSGVVLANTRIRLVEENTGEDKILTTDALGFLSFDAPEESNFLIITQGGEETGTVQNWNRQSLLSESNRITLSSSASQPEVNSPSIIKLVVTDSRTAQPLVVTCQLTDAKTQKTIKSSADGNGYIFRGVANNNYVLKVSAKGYVNQAKLISTLSNPAGDTVSVKITLNKILPTNVPVIVEVVDEANGSPVANARLYLLNENTSDEKYLTTDQTGLISFNADPTASYSIIADKDEKSGSLINLNPAEVIGKGSVRLYVSKLRHAEGGGNNQPLAVHKKQNDSSIISETSGAAAESIKPANKNRQFTPAKQTGSEMIDNNALGAEIYAIHNTSGLEQVFVRYKGRTFEFKQDENLKYLQTINGKMRLVIDQTEDEEKDLARLLEHKLTEANMSIKSFTKISSIYYNSDQTQLREDARVEMDKLVNLLKMVTNLKIEVRAHTDSRESNEYNKSLSAQRAKEASAYLISKGIVQARVRISFFGEKALVNDCSDGVKCSEEKHQQNRRTEFLIQY